MSHFGAVKRHVPCFNAMLFKWPSLRVTHSWQRNGTLTPAESKLLDDGVLSLDWTTTVHAATTMRGWKLREMKAMGKEDVAWGRINWMEHCCKTPWHICPKFGLKQQYLHMAKFALVSSSPLCSVILKTFRTPTRTPTHHDHPPPRAFVSGQRLSFSIKINNIGLSLFNLIIYIFNHLLTF